MHDAALVRERHVRAGQDVVCDGLAEDFNTQHISDDLLRLALQIGMYERNMVVGADDVAERGQALFDSLDLDAIRDRIAEMLQFLVGGRGRYEQPFAVACCEAPYDACAGDGGVADGNDVLQFGFEDGVEVLGGADGDEGVGICKGGEDANSARGLVWFFLLRLGAVCSGWRRTRWSFQRLRGQP